MCSVHMRALEEGSKRGRSNFCSGSGPGCLGSAVRHRSALMLTAPFRQYRYFCRRGSRRMRSVEQYFEKGRTGPGMATRRPQPAQLPARAISGHIRQTSRFGEFCPDCGRSRPYVIQHGGIRHDSASPDFAQALFRNDQELLVRLGGRVWRRPELVGEGGRSSFRPHSHVRTSGRPDTKCWESNFESGQTSGKLQPTSAEITRM